jgi:glycosidase
MSTRARLAVASLALVTASLTASCSSDKASAPQITYPEKDHAAESARLLGTSDWYRHAVFYEVDVRSFSDSNGDGIGDLKGLQSRLSYLKDLGVDALWLMPIMPSPFKDSGYDVADYEAIQKEYGTLADFDALVTAAHAQGIRVFMDLVLNHTSDQHAWFQDSRSSKTSQHADYYVWSDTQSRADIGCGTYGVQFGEQAWTLAPERNQYYFHRFYPGQPDLNYKNPAVVKATLDSAKFWMDRGVDGFRCDVIGLLVETAQGCDMQPETQAYIKQLRTLLDGYKDRAMVAESTNYSDASAYYGSGSNMFNMAFDFGYGYLWGGVMKSTTAADVAKPFLAAGKQNPKGSQEALVIGSHDVPRAYTVANHVQSRWRRAALVQLTMPGTPFIYYGEEIALRPGTQQVVDGRDTARTPMMWDGTAGHGFSTAKPWIAFGAEGDTVNVEAEQKDPTSDLAFYKQLLALRRGREAFGTGSLKVVAADDPTVLYFERASADETYVIVMSMDETDPHTATVPGVALPGDAQRLFGDATLSRSGNDASVTVTPGGYGIFRVR